MNKSFSISIIFVLLSFCGFSQALNIPRASPQAWVGQMVGVCRIDVGYSRPQVKGREVFGQLVPYDKVWRVGANEATTVTFSKDIMINEEVLAAGKYGLFAIPKKDNWTIIFNKQWDQWGAYNHDPSFDVLSLDVPVNRVSKTEMLTIGFDEVTKSSAKITIAWDEVMIELPVTVSTAEQTLAEIDSVVEEARAKWYIYSAAAQYHYYELRDKEKGLFYINMAIGLDAPNPAPWMLKSQILAEQGKYLEAIANAEKAIEVSKAYEFWFEVEENEAQISKWKSKL